MPEARSARTCRALLVCLALLPGGCLGGARAEGRWPPADFHLWLEQQERIGGVLRPVRQAEVYADGLVVLREAAAWLDTEAGGGLSLPVFRSLCVYRMHPRSVRSLSRELHQLPVLRLEQPPVPLAGQRIDETLRMRLVYLDNHLDLLCQNRSYGLFNSCLRLCNSFLPPGHGFRMQDMAGIPLESRVQDVPLPKEDLAGSLAEHQRLLEQRPEDLELRRVVFALACAQGEFAVAERCLTRLEAARPGDAVALRALLRAQRDR